MNSRLTSLAGVKVELEGEVELLQGLVERQSGRVVLGGVKAKPFGQP